MNSIIVCFETIAVFVFSFCFICDSTDSTLTRGPNDTSVILGGNVKLDCFTGNKDYPPAWSHQKVGSGERRDISLVFKQGDLIVPRLLDGYVKRHSIVGDSNTGDYSLQITDVNPEDAGTYFCTARGGLAERHSAELSVFEPHPTCEPNITDVVGENDCHREPDFIEFTCKFRVHGNYLPKVTWTVANRPEKVMKIDNPTVDATGMASSKLFIRGNYVGLDTTSFQCTVASAEEANVNGSTCVTPKTNVLKISNLAESKALEAPEEVECTQCAGWTKLNASGCDWFRREDDNNGQQKETHVTSKSLLNLYRSEMKPGTYICVANCNIRGELCRVKLLNVSYKPLGSESVQSGNANGGVLVPVLVVVAVVTIVVIAIILAVLLWKWWKNRHGSRTESPASNDSNLQNQQVVPLLHINHSSTEVRNGDPANVPAENIGGPTKVTSTGSDSSSDSGLPSEQSTPPSSQETLLTGSDNSSTPSEQSIPPSSQEPPKDFSIDIPDAKSGGLTKADRARLAEEKALARMRKNAALRSGEDNPMFSADTDVAEGVAADKKKD